MAGVAVSSSLRAMVVMTIYMVSVGAIIRVCLCSQKRLKID